MTTVRVGKRERGFTIVDNQPITDDRLTFKAKGVLLWLLSKPDDWSVRAESIGNVGPDGRDSVRSALKELEECGYLIRDKRRGPDGAWTTTHTVFEVPQSENQGGKPAVVPERPSQGGLSNVGSSGAITSTETDDCNEELQLNPPTPQPLKLVAEPAPSGGVGELPGIPPPFEQFYAAYPVHKGREGALKAWNRAVHRAAADRIIRKAKEYAADPNRVDQYTPYPSKWLNEGRWDDDPCLPRNGAGPQSRQQAVDTDRDAPSGQMWIHPDGEWRYHPPEASNAGR